MNFNNNILTAQNDMQEYNNSLQYYSNYEINPRLKRSNYYEQIPFYSDYSSNNCNKIIHQINNSNSKFLSHKDFHNKAKIKEYNSKTLHNKFKNKFFDKKQLINKYESSSSIEKDLDMMKIQMSCNLITYKINQIKNKVQDLNDSSKKDNKELLKNKNSDIKEINTYNSNKIRRHQNMKSMPMSYYFDINTINNTLNEDYYDKNYQINDFHTLDESIIKNVKYNNIRLKNYKYDKIPNSNTNKKPNNKNYFSNNNKNVLKYMILNSTQENQNQNFSISTIHNNKKKNSNILINENGNNINLNFQNINENIIQSYTNKKKNYII